MNRDEMIARLAGPPAGWDIIIIGGGATGLGCAVDASARGYRTLLLEKGDFGNATSSRSTKLIHGGVRYLQQGNFKLVRESLRERALLLRNAPGLVRPLPFIVPAYKWWERPFFGIGLKLYDALAGKERTGRSQSVSREGMQQHLPTLRMEGLRGGTLYHDAQFDDARLAIALAQTAAGLGAVVINYCAVTALLKTNHRITAVVARDLETGRDYELPAKVVINATGIFTDAIRRLDEGGAAPMMAMSRGSHIVLDGEFLPGETALIVPKTDDGRVLFLIPWRGKVLVGTTDIAVKEPANDPNPSAEEIDYLLDHAARYLTRAPTRGDIKSTFAGLRPLVRQGRATNTALVPRDHTLLVSPSRLVTITGGKWTTYRKMAEETVNRAAEAGGLSFRPCSTAQVKIRGAEQSDKASVARAIREEMARTVEDVLARRTRSLILDAAGSVGEAPSVAAALASELKRDEAWQKQQIQSYTQLARRYLVGAAPGRRNQEELPRG